MATANIVAAYKDADNAYASARVAEGGGKGNVEYGPVITPLKKEDGANKTNAEIKADLTLALKAARDAQTPPASQALGGVSGAVTI